MQKFYKIGYLLLAMSVLVFIVLPQSTSAETTNEQEVDNILSDKLDQETINTINEVEKYLIASEDGNFKVDLKSAKSDNADPEVLNILEKASENEENEEGEISILSFDLPIGNYGNYCGKGNLGGQPIDDLDSACQYHDGCFKGFSDTSAANKKCNMGFIKRLAPIIYKNNGLTTKGAYARAAVAIFKHYV